MNVQDAEHVFKLLSELLRSAHPDWIIAKDGPQHLEVHAVWPERAQQRAWFGAVSIKKRYVSYHLMPLYTHPEFLEDIPEGLKRRRQGKTCFNFTAVDEALFQALNAVTQRCAAAWAHGS